VALRLAREQVDDRADEQTADRRSDESSPPCEVHSGREQIRIFDPECAAQHRDHRDQQRLG